MFHLPRTRFYTFMGSHARNPICHPPPHLRPGPLASPLKTATAATLVDRALASIATVKVFNATPCERQTLDAILDRLNHTSKKLNAVWGATSTAAQFVTMAMFA
jgi:hypothetical protein